MAIAAATAGLMISAPITPSRASASSAPLTFCNRTSDSASVAAGYYSQGISDPSDHSILTGPLISRGWWKVEPGQCVSISNPFDARYVFWYAVSKGYNDGEMTVYSLELADLPGRLRFCVPNYFTAGAGQGAFQFEDQNVSYAACHADGKIWVLVHKTDTAVDPTVNFMGNDGNY